MKYEWVCEHVIVLDACYTIKCPTTMWLAKHFFLMHSHIVPLPLFLQTHYITNIVVV